MLNFSIQCQDQRLQTEVHPLHRLRFLVADSSASPWHQLAVALCSWRAESPNCQWICLSEKLLGVRRKDISRQPGVGTQTSLEKQSSARRPHVGLQSTCYMNLSWGRLPLFLLLPRSWVVFCQGRFLSWSFDKLCLCSLSGLRIKAKRGCQPQRKTAKLCKAMQSSPNSKDKNHQEPSRTS